MFLRTHVISSQEKPGAVISDRMEIKTIPQKIQKKISKTITSAGPEGVPPGRFKTVEIFVDSHRLGVNDGSCAFQQSPIFIVVPSTVNVEKILPWKKISEMFPMSVF